MTTTEPATKPTVFEALTAVMAEVKAVGKTDRNNEQGYDFRGIDGVINAVGPVFRKHGIIALPVRTEAKYRDVLTIRDKRSRECTVSVTYRFYGPAGDFIDCEVPGESMDFGDKGTAKAMSVAYRIALLQTLCIPTHDPDPDSSAYERASEPQWDAIEQAGRLADWLAEINGTRDLEALNAVSRRLRAALQSRELAPEIYKQAWQRGKERMEEIEAMSRQDAAAETPHDGPNGKAEGVVIGASA